MSVLNLQDAYGGKKTAPVKGVLGLSDRYAKMQKEDEERKRREEEQRKRQEEARRQLDTAMGKTPAEEVLTVNGAGGQITPSSPVNLLNMPIEKVARLNTPIPQPKPKLRANEFPIGEGFGETLGGSAGQERFGAETRVRGYIPKANTYTEMLAGNSPEMDKVIKTEPDIIRASAEAFPRVVGTFMATAINKPIQVGRGEPMLPISKRMTETEEKYGKFLGPAIVGLGLSVDTLDVLPGGAEAEKAGKELVEQLIKKVGKDEARDMIILTAKKALPEIQQAVNTGKATITEWSKLNKYLEMTERGVETAQETHDVANILLKQKYDVGYMPEGFVRKTVSDVGKTGGDAATTMAFERKQRGFLTSLKENPRTEAVFKDVEDLYDIRVNERDLLKARQLADTNLPEARQLAFSNEVSSDAVAARVTLLNDAIARGDWEEARQLGVHAAREFTPAAQMVQAGRMLDVDSPAKAVVRAAQQIEDFNKTKLPKLEGKIAALEKQFAKVNLESAEQAAREVSESLPKFTKPSVVKQPTKSKLLTLAERIAKQEELYPVERRLADRIRVGTKAPKADPIKDMLNTLYKVAKELLPAKKKAVPKSEIELIGQALRDRDTYRDIWVKAQDIVKERYAGKPKLLAKLNEYFDEFLLSGRTELPNDLAHLPIAKSQVNKAVGQEMKAEAINLSRIVKEHYTVVDNSGRDLLEKLIDKANIPAKEAAILSGKIQRRFNELVSKRKEAILKSIFNERKVTTDKGFVDRIVEWSNLGAFNKREFYDQIAKKFGLASMSPELASKISKQAQLIATLPKGYEKYKQTQVMLKMIADEMPVSYAEVVGQVLNIPRTLMASFFDLSFGFRQGLIGGYSEPKNWLKAFKGQFKNFALEKEYEKAMDLVIKHPLYDTAKKAGVSFTDLGAKMGSREEKYMSSYAEKIPLLGKGVRMTSRAYTGMANKLRMDNFASLVEQAIKMGDDPLNNPVLLESMANWINLSTGRGKLKGKLFGVIPVNLEGAATALNATLFSPRLMASRLTLLTPGYYLQAEPLVRKKALKAMFAYASSSMVVLGLADLIPGVDVGKDPRSADFGKIKVGNTRIDILGGFQQYVRMAAQLISGKYISSTTGKEYTLGEGYKPMTRLDIVQRQLETKEAPIASFITDWLRGTDYSGKKFTVTGGLRQRITPMMAQDIYDLYKEDPSMLPYGLPGVFGMGVQTYEPEPKGNKLPKLPKLPSLPKAP